MVIAWADGDKVLGSIRTVAGYTAPTAVDNAALSLAPIANGTFVNSTHFSYTFLCKGCVGSSVTQRTFNLTTDNVITGWAMSSTTPTNPSSASAAVPAFHNSFGLFGLIVADTKSASYSLWESWASAGATPAPGTPTPGNGTTPADPTCPSNTTATVSDSTYDYIVAGGGPAGIITAQRLAEAGKSVLLLERGKASTYASGGRSVVAWNETVTQYDVPSMAYYLSSAADTTGYCTDVASQAGCILGGGTSVNALVFIRPQKVDFDDKWPSGWKWNDVSASAEKLYERNPGTTQPSKDGQYYDQAAWNVLSTFLTSSLGFSQVDAIEDPNTKTKVFTHPSWSISNGLRQGPVVSYLPRAQALPNFTLSLQTKVIRVIRNGSTMTGVEVETISGARQIINLKAGGSVILASGALSTPRILINSGIGPSSQIDIVKKTCGVTLPAEKDLIDLPVGENLHDHPIFTLKFNIKSENATSLLGADFTSPSQTNIDLFAKASGPLVQSGQRLIFFSNIKSESGTRYFQGTCNSPSKGVVQMKIYLTHGATSKGSLGVTATQTTEYIKSPLLNTQEDKDAAAEFIDSILNAAKNSTVLSPSDATLTGTKAIETFVSGSHFVGTAMMGASDDGNAVVDTNTKVFKTDNLFVVDASIHPDLPTGNTQAIVMVVAEKAAEKILALGAAAGNGTTPVVPGGGNSTAPPASTVSAPVPVGTTAPPAESQVPGEEDDCE